MKSNSNKPMRPLTPRMMDLLKECFQRELEKKPPLDTYYTQSSKGLFERGFFYMKEYTVNGKTLMRFCITEQGRIYLQNLTENQLLKNESR